jgi:1,4-dihydroxy-2-naphthoate octaprenyltransferase
VIAAPVRPLGWRVWLLAARPATLPAAVVPVLVGTAAAVGGGAAPRPGPFVGALAAAVLIQVGTNLANDYFDYRKGADTIARLGPTRVTQSGLVAPSTVRAATALTFGLAALIGLYLVWVGGWPILVVGLLSILSGIAYTGGPWPLGYHGLGDLFVFVFFGVVAVTGSAYLQTGQLEPFALLASVPVGMLVTAILVVNNLRDVETDRAAGKRTLADRRRGGSTPCSCSAPTSRRCCSGSRARSDGRSGCPGSRCRSGWDWCGWSSSASRGRG